MYISVCPSYVHSQNKTKRENNKFQFNGVICNIVSHKIANEAKRFIYKYFFLPNPLLPIYIIFLQNIFS